MPAIGQLQQTSATCWAVPCRYGREHDGGRTSYIGLIRPCWPIQPHISLIFAAHMRHVAVSMICNLCKCLLCLFLAGHTHDLRFVCACLSWPYQCNGPLSFSQVCRCILILGHIWYLSSMLRSLRAACRSVGLHAHKLHHLQTHTAPAGPTELLPSADEEIEPMGSPLLSAHPPAYANGGICQAKDGCTKRLMCTTIISF